MQDVEDGLSEFPHVIVNQARLQALLLEHMERSPRRLVPDYGVSATSLRRGASDDDPVTVAVTYADGSTGSIRARYVVGCDGARSAVRTAIGRELHGDRQDKAWGVLDVRSPTSPTSGARSSSSPASTATCSSSRARADTSCGSMSTSATSMRAIAASGSARRPTT